MVINSYLEIRMKYKTANFPIGTIRMIDNHIHKSGLNYNTQHPLVDFNPFMDFENKGVSDDYAIKLWNEISNVPNITRIEEIASSAELQMSKIDHTDKNISEADFVRYSIAFSYSSFYGIQHPKNSKYAKKSFEKTLESHCSSRRYVRPWLYEHLSDFSLYIAHNPHVMSVDYSELCLNAKMSSSSIRMAPKFRDFVFTHTLDDVISYVQKDKYVDKKYVAGIRNDRRGKYRLIFSLGAIMRIIDFLINHGTYKLFHKGTPFSKFVTEGMTESEMWAQMKLMSVRSDYDLVCLDYEGYDTQIYQYDYADISKVLNKYRMNNPQFKSIFDYFYNWMLQPKPLVTVINGRDVVLIPKVSTLASGLHGTHSFENIIGYATYKYLLSHGVVIDRAWFNGDDQNFLVYRPHVKKFMDVINKNFKVSERKSLIGSVLGVWSRLWFTNKYYPSPEIGTFRSIWEKESGSIDAVENSKIASNYCKIVSVAMVLIRLGKSEEVVRDWIASLCKVSNPPINPNRLPISLEGLHTKSGSGTAKIYPRGLDSAKSKLLELNLSFKMLNVPNYYSMLYNMYSKRQYFSFEPQIIQYADKLVIEPNYDYSNRDYFHTPWIFRRFKDVKTDTDISLIQTVLQSTHSYDGPCSVRYEVRDMYELALAINDRNKITWNRL